MSRPSFTSATDTANEQAARAGDVRWKDETATLSPGGMQTVVLVEGDDIDHWGLMVEQITSVIDYESLSASDTSREAFLVRIRVIETDDTNGQDIAIEQTVPAGEVVDFNQPLPVYENYSLEIEMQYNDSDATGDVTVHAGSIMRNSDTVGTL